MCLIINVFMFLCLQVSLVRQDVVMRLVIKIKLTFMLNTRNLCY